jgi:excisionase family DNA binding protein
MDAKEIKQIVTEVLEKHFGKINDLHKEILDVYELAEYLNLSPSYIRKLTSKKEIPFYKPMGKKNIFS